MAGSVGHTGENRAGLCGLVGPLSLASSRRVRGVIYCGGQGCNGFVVPDDAQSGDTGGEDECFDSLGTAYRGSGISSYLNETDYGPNEKLGHRG